MGCQQQSTSNQYPVSSNINYQLSTINHQPTNYFINGSPLPHLLPNFMRGPNLKHPGLVNVFIPLVLFMLFSTTMQAQLSKVDSLMLHQSIYAARQKYNEAIGGNSHVYNGPEYVSPVQQKKVIGDPYYFDYDWQEGSVHFSDHLYENVSLRYDLLKDNLLLEFSQGYESIELITNRIKYFVIHDHTFVRLSPSAGQSTMEEGFYDLVYDGQSKVVVKRYKVIKEITDQGIMTVEYIEKRKLFLQQGERFIPIRVKRDALNAFAANKTELRKFLAREKIHFKSDPEMALAAMATVNDQLQK